MNEIAKKFLLVEDKFVPEMHLRQSRFTYSACRTFTKNKEKIQKFKETGDSLHIYQNELHKACLQHDMAHGDFKDLTNRKTSDKTLYDKLSILLKILNMMNINADLLQWLINFLIKKLLVVVLKMRICQTSN